MIRSMTAIIVKELRENLLWAALILLVTSGALATSIAAGLHNGLPLIEDTTITVCMLMYPAAGLLLGLAQIFQDARRGRWQFIVHRPISRVYLFAGKVAAGLILYAIATLIPFAIATAWVAMPGHVAGPFTSDMIQPVLAMIISGIAWYGVGLLIASRKASWFGSRLMPAGVAVAGSMLCYLSAMTFLQAVIIASVCIVVLFSAAWGSFIGDTETSRVPWWSKPTMGISVAAGCIAIVYVGMALGAGVINTITEQKEWSYRLYILNPQGDLQIETLGRDTTAYADLAGHPIVGLADDHGRHPELPCISLATVDDTQRRFWPNYAGVSGFLRRSSHAELMNWDAGICWYYLPVAKLLEGYELKTCRFVGSIGASGFAAPGEVAKPFSGRTLNNFSRDAHDLLLTFSDGVVYVDLTARKVDRVFSALPDQPVIDSGQQQFTKAESSYDRSAGQLLSVTTKNAIHLFANHQPWMTIPIERGKWNSDRVAIGKTDSGDVAVASGLGYVERGAHVTIYSPDGKRLRSVDAQDTLQSPNDEPHFYNYIDYLGELFAPPLFFAAMSARNWYLYSFIYWRGLADITGVAAIFMVIAFAILRRRHVSRNRTLVWFAVVACLGLSGIFLLLSTVQRVASAPCPRCRKRRLVTEAVCGHCSTPAPPPQMEGIEIFEPLVSPAG